MDHRILLIPVDAEEHNPLGMNKEPKATEPTDKQKSKPKGQDVLVGALMYDVARKISINAISRVGAATGNYMIQNQIRTTMNLAAYGLAIAKGGPIGAVYVGLDVGMKVFDYNLTRDKATRETQGYREMVGLSTSQGSRLGGRKL